MIKAKCDMKILFVDTWSKGTFFTNPVVEYIDKMNSIYFLHANSLYNYNPEQNSFNDSYKFYDINNYGNSLFNAIQDIKPDVVVFISIHGLFHRWANIICSSLGIKTLFFMHGVRGLPQKPTYLKSPKVFLSKFARVFSYTKQYYFMTRDLIRSKNFKILFILDWFELIFRNYKYTYNPTNKVFFNYDKICLNDSSDMKFMSTSYGISPSNMIVSGNVSARQIAYQSIDIKINQQRVVFYSQPIVLLSMLSKQVIKNSLLRIAKSVMKETNLPMVLRLHPRDDFCLEDFSEYSFIEVSNEEVAVDMARTRLAIGYFSAILLSCIDLKIPLLSISVESFPRIPVIENYSLNQKVILNKEDWEMNVNAFLIGHSKTNRKLAKEILPSSKIIADEIEKLL